MTIDPAQPPVLLSFTVTEPAADVAARFCAANGLASDSIGAISHFVSGHQRAAMEHEAHRRAAPAATRAAAVAAGSGGRLLSNHTYAVQELADGQHDRLVLLRNPWGVEVSPPGALSHEAARAELGERGVPAGDSFWLRWVTFTEKFNALTLCKPLPVGAHCLFAAGI